MGESAAYASTMTAATDLLVDNLDLLPLAMGINLELLTLVLVLLI